MSHLLPNSRLTLKHDSVNEPEHLPAHWIQDEANRLMDELFEGSVSSSRQDSSWAYLRSAPKDWSEETYSPLPSSNLALYEEPRWDELLEPSRDLDPASWSADPSPWIPEAESAAVHRRRFLALLGLAGLVLPLGLWGSHQVLHGSQTTPAVVATQPQGSVAEMTSDQKFADYAQKAFRQIQARSAAPATTVASRPPTLAYPLGIMSASVSGAPSQPPQETIAQSPPTLPTADQSAQMQRMALRVVKPTQIQAPPVPPVTGTSPAATATPSRSTVAGSPEPSGSLPSLTSQAPNPTLSLAKLQPMGTPANASHKVIGIVEMGLQSTLMVSSNGSYRNFQIGDTVNQQGWQLVQITDGKAILQKGSEHKTLSEGQHF
ncbi:hypothetical protein [Lyngbya confervoides]|uniref:Type II secretion system protein GspC N-terminal domain-containing protein n=1 Tax=Lyngbya confervoides BDU141951 TaxID=1574623 RepID=A0ABD4SZ84_9CYAN|nr:hypothetical protein [Lyngbya confervoides]MCM1981736.1 hypothetical protein [Lyngbya confervoides BDU141951]